MIFYLEQEVQGAAGKIKKNVFLGGNFDVGNQKLNVNAIALITDKEIRKLISSSFDFKICKTNSFSVPIITVEDYVVKALPHANATKLYQYYITVCKKGFGLDISLDQALEEYNMPVFKQYVDKCKEIARPKLEKILGENVNFFIECLLGFYRYSKYFSLSEFDSPAISQIDNDFIAETQEYISSFKKQIVIGDNKTLKQNTYNSEFFIELPSWYSLTNDELDDVSKLIPNLNEEVCHPYVENIAYTPSYKNAKITSLNLIEGNAKNNGHIVFQYDERYYDSLISWCKNNMLEYYKDTLKSINDITDSAVIDPYSQEYLVELSKSLYSLHWSHNKNVPCSVSIDDNDAEDSSINSTSKYVFYGDAGEQNSFMNALVLLEEFLKMASVECGYKVYLQAVLQLSRWGLDKPTAITFENYDKMFLLGTNTIVDKEIPLDRCELKQREGCDFYLDKLIYLDKEITDKDLLSSEFIKEFGNKFEAPVGIVLSADYVDKTSKKEITNSVYYSFIDFVRKIVQDSNFANNIYGFTYDNGLFRIQDDLKLNHFVTVEELLLKIKNNNSVYNPFYRSQDLVNVYMSVNSKLDSEIPDSILKILNDKIGSLSLSTDFEMIKFNSKEELFEKKKSYQILCSAQNAISISVLRAVLPIFAEANARILHEFGDNVKLSCSEPKFLEKVLKIYKEIMDVSFISEVNFYESITHVDDYKKSEESSKIDEDTSVKEQISNATGNDNSETMKNMDLFHGSSEKNNDRFERTEHGAAGGSKNQEQSDNIGSGKMDQAVNIRSGKIEQADNAFSDDILNSLLFKKPGKGVKILIKFVRFDETKYIGVLLRCVNKDNFTEFIFSSVEDFNQLYPGYLNKIKTSEKFVSLVNVFLNQQTKINQKINGKLYFMNANSYNTFSKGILALLKK